GAVLAACAGALDLFTIPEQTRARRTAVLHASLNLVVTAAYAAGFAWRYKAAHPAPVPAAQIALSAVSLAVLAVSGFLGGKLASRYGVRAPAEATRAAAPDPPAAQARPSPASWP